MLTRDKRIRYRQLERLALTETKARAFVFTGGNVTGKDTAAIPVHAQRRTAPKAVSATKLAY